MTIAGRSEAGPPADAGAQEGAAEGPVPGRRPDLEPIPGPAPGTDQGRLSTPPFSWLGSDAWPNFPLWADKPG
jgi:hypothetical protein